MTYDITPDEIERLQEHVSEVSRQGDEPKEVDRLPADVLENIVTKAVISSRQGTEKRMHLNSRGDGVGVPCQASLSSEREWLEKDIARLKGWFEWCDRCRAIAHDRYRP
jgi:hypothetical protein